MPIDNILWHARVGHFNTTVHRFFFNNNVTINHPLEIESFLTYPLTSFTAYALTIVLFFYFVSYLGLFRKDIVSVASTKRSKSKYPPYVRNFTYIIVIGLNIIISYITIFNETLLLRSGDIELNPGPKKLSNLTFFHWNLNGIAAHDFVKMTLIHSYVALHHTDIICLSETFLDSSIEKDDPKINIPGYNILRCDHPSDTKRGGICVFYKEHLPIIRRDDLCTLSECIVIEINTGNKSIFLTCNYRSPSQTPDEFETYCQNLNLTLANIDDSSPLCSVLIGDFNARNSALWSDDKTS